MTFFILNTVKQNLEQKAKICMLPIADYILHLCSPFLLLYCYKRKSNQVKLHKMDLFDPLQYKNEHVTSVYSS